MTTVEVLETPPEAEDHPEGPPDAARGREADLIAAPWYYARKIPGLYVKAVQISETNYHRYGDDPENIGEWVIWPEGVNPDGWSVFPRFVLWYGVLNARHNRARRRSIWKTRLASTLARGGTVFPRGYQNRAARRKKKGS